MTTSAGSAAFLLFAGVLAGVVGTAGGITSLVSYPALLAVGVPRCRRTSRTWSPGSPAGPQRS